jgi:hypothetical protein
MDRVNGLAQRLNQNLLSVTKRSPPSSGQPPRTLTSGGSAPVILSSRFETGAITSGTNSKLHELFIVPESKVGASGKTLCYTCIGYNGLFCIKEDCDTSHRGSGPYKAEVGDIHILNKQGEAFIQPKIRSIDMADELVTEWTMMGRESLQDWTTKFGVVNSTDHSTILSSADMEASEKFSQFAVAWKTPAKRARSDLLLPDRILPGPEEDFSFVKNIPDDPSILINQIGWDSAKGGRVVRALVNIESALESSNITNQATFEIVNDELVAGKATSEILLSKINYIKSRLGAPSGEEGLLSSPTLWGAIYELAGMISGDPDKPREEEILSDQVMERMQYLVEDYAEHHWKPFLGRTLEDYTTTAACNANIGLLLDGAERVNDDLNNLLKKIKALESATGPKQNSPHSNLRARMDRYGSGISSQVGPLDIDTAPPNLQEDREALGEKVQRLTTQVHKIIAEASESAISFGGLGLKSIREVDSWLAANPYALRHYGLCPDVMIFLEWVADDMAKGEKITEQLRKLKKLGFGTAAEARACDSFAYSLPRVFAGEGEDHVHAADKSYFPTVKTSAIWSGKGWGTWDRIKTSMDKVKTAFESQIRASIPSSDPTYNLFMLAVSEVYSWLEGFEKEILADMCAGLVLNQFSEAAGWSLSTRLGVRVLEEVGQHRIGVASLISSNNEDSNASHVLYATFRTLDEMAIFKKFKYKNHPCISSEFVKFMASNSGLDSIKKLEARVKTLEGELKEAREKAKSSATKADTASNKADQSARDLIALAKRVKLLE